MAGIFVVSAGCNGNGGSSAIPKARRPFADVKLKIGCDDPSIAKELVRRATAWSGRTGAAVEVSTLEDCDVAIVAPGELGARIARRDALPVPGDTRNSAHALQWSRFLSVWSDRLASWGGTPHGIPLAGESYVLAYRADILAGGTEKFKDRKSVV